MCLKEYIHIYIYTYIHIYICIYIYNTHRNDIICNSVECSMPTSDRRRECIGYIQGVLHVKKTTEKRNGSIHSHKLF